LHVASLMARAAFLDEGRPAPGDTKETLIRLLKRAVTEVPWPELPEKAEDMFNRQFRALTIIAEFGEPEAAVEILSRHVQNIEGHVVAPLHVAEYYFHRTDWLLAPVHLAKYYCGLASLCGGKVRRR
jgi:hypothetical protein